MIDIFELSGNPMFFSILSRQFKDLYWDVIGRIHSIIVSEADSKVDKVTAKMVIDESIVDFNNETDSYMFASESNDILNTLLETGWLDQTYDGVKGLDFFSFTNYAKRFIDFNEAYQDNRVKTEEYMKLLEMAVDDMLDADKDSDAYKNPYRGGILKLKDYSDSLISEVENIGRNILLDIDSIFKTTNTQELIDKMEKYISDVNEGYIANLYKYSRLRPSLNMKIQDMISSVKTDNEFRGRIVEDMKRHYMILGADKSDSELVEEMYSLIEHIHEKLSVDLRKRRESVERLKTEAISRSMHKFDLLSASNHSFPKILDKIINILFEAVGNDEEFALATIAEMFNYTESVVAEPGNLYERKDAKPAEVIEPITDVPVDEADIEKAKESFVSTIDTANGYALEFLGEKDEIALSEIQVSEENVEKVKFLSYYADYKDAKYGVEILGEKIVFGSYIVDNFILRRVV